MQHKFRRKPSTTKHFDLSIPEHSYIFGLLLSDGSFDWADGVGKGKISLELNVADRDILDNIRSVLDVSAPVKTRTRNTNFKDSYTSACLTICSLEFRMSAKSYGLPVGCKAYTAAPPIVPYIEQDFWRGYIDGDGSLGLTSVGFPFVSLTTMSDALVAAYTDFLFRNLSVTKTTRRNTRNKCYNIMVTKEDAQNLVQILNYGTAKIALQRKRCLASAVEAWVRPASMRKVLEQRGWDEEQDKIVLMHTVKEAAKILGRSPSSVSNRRFRLPRNIL